MIGLASTLLMGVVSIVVMVFGGRLILSGSMTIGDFFAFTLYLGFMVAPVFQMVSIGTQITEAFAGLDRMHEVFEEQPEDVDPERTVQLGPIQGHIHFNDVGFEYEAGKPVLRDIALDAVPGTVTALVGSSGSGKSTLIGLVQPSPNLSEAVSRSMAMIFQACDSTRTARKSASFSKTTSCSTEHQGKHSFRTAGRIG